MDGIIKGPWSESPKQTVSQQNEAKEEQKKSRQKSRRKWWKISRNEKEENTQEDENNVSETPLLNNSGCCEILDVNVVNGVRTVKSTNESMDFSLKFSVNKKPSLDPLDVNNVKKHEKKKKRKDKKTSVNESSDIYKKTGKSKSASTQSPQSQNPFQRSEIPRETVDSPTDSEFWGFSSTRSPLNFNVDNALDANTIVDRPVDKAPTASDDEYEAEMAYRFPFLYKRLSKQQPQNTSTGDLRDPERHVPTPKPPGQEPEIRGADEIKKPFKINSPDSFCNRRNVYILDRDTDMSTAVFSCSQDDVKKSDAHAVNKNKNIATFSCSTLNEDRNLGIVSRGMVDKKKNMATVSHNDAAGSKVNIADKDIDMVTVSHSNVQEENMDAEYQDTGTSDGISKGLRVQFKDDLSSDIDRLLDELDDIW